MRGSPPQPVGLDDAACAALKRFGPPKEFAELLAFCAISKPGYFTGVDMLCDGGTRPDSR